MTGYFAILSNNHTSLNLYKSSDPATIVYTAFISIYKTEYADVFANLDIFQVLFVVINVNSFHIILFLPLFLYSLSIAVKPLIFLLLLIPIAHWIMAVFFE